MLKHQKFFRGGRGPVRVLAALIVANVGSAGHTEHKVGIEPPADTERIVTVGSPVFQRFNYDLKKVAVANADVVKVVLFPIRIPAGTPLEQTSSKAKFKACMGPFDPCALDDDGYGTFDRIAKDDTSAAFGLPVPVPYEIREIVNSSAGNFKEILSHMGATSDTLRLSYREFSNDFARPAFTEELSLPLGKTFPQQIAVKDLKITVLAIDGMRLRYRIER